jgi:hypothetical protein
MAVTLSGTGCDVLVQSEGARTCQGFRGIAVSRPVRILVRPGSADVPDAAEARAVARWLDSRRDAAAAAEVVTPERRLFVSYSHSDGMALAHAVARTLSEARRSQPHRVGPPAARSFKTIGIDAA